MRTWLPLLATAVLATAACDDNDDTTAPTGAITLTSTSTAATLSIGSTTTIPLTVTRSGGFNGSVTLTAEGLPTGVTASFDPTTLTNATATIVVIVTAPSA